MLTQAIFLTQENPYPPHSGAKIRETRLIGFLAEHLSLEVLCLASPGTPGGTFCVDPGVRVTALERGSTPIWRRALEPLRPRLAQGYSESMARLLRARFKPGTLLWVSRLSMAQYVPLARSLGYRIILDGQQLESSILLDSALSSVRGLPRLWHAAQCSLFEEKACSQTDAVVTSSDLDASRVMKRIADASVHVIPNSVDCGNYASLRENPGNSLFFAGSLNNAANIEGLHWFLDEVLPRLRAQLGFDLPRIVVAGSNPPDSLRARLIEAGIELHANPPRIHSFLGDAAVVFHPIRSAGSSRISILEAMAAGRAVVSTGKGIEGLVLSPTFDIWIADHADAFASTILRLLGDPLARAELGRQAALTVETRYDWTQARVRLQALLHSLRGGAELDSPRPAPLSP